MESVLKKEKRKIGLGEHFTYGKLLRFAMPSVIMMVFTSIYGVVDGLFISNFVGKTAFAAVNLIMPVPIALGAVGFMVGAGGSAIVAKTLGEGDEKRAKEYFTMLVVFAVTLGVILTAAGQLLLEPVARALGATDDMMAHCMTYGRILLVSLTFFLLQNVFQNLLVTAEKPKIGLAVIVAAGCTNIALDALFVAVFKWGVAGAAVATAISQLIGGGLPVIYFLRKNNSLLRFTKFGIHGKVLVKTCTNGSSELVGNIAASVVSMLYNKQLLKLVGDEGVDAYGIMLYVQFVFVAIFIGYCLAVTPVVGYNYGAQNRAELQSLLGKSFRIIGVTSLVMTGLCFALARPLALLFVSGNAELCDMTQHGMYLYSICFLLAGFNMFGSAFFTALNNGLVSAVLSFSRTLVFQILCIYVLPLFFGLDGIWISTAVAEALSLVLTVAMFICNNKKYGYFSRKVKADA